LILYTNFYVNDILQEGRRIMRNILAGGLEDQTPSCVNSSVALARCDTRPMWWPWTSSRRLGISRCRYGRLWVYC